MKIVQAFDANKNEIKYGDLVRIVKPSGSNHHWLRVGNTLRVSSWEDRTLGKTPFICVFLESKAEGKKCQMGIQDHLLEIVPEN